MSHPEARTYGQKRKAPRRHLIYYLRVFDQDTGEMLGNLVDISTRGIMLVSDKPIAVDRPFNLRMVLPDSLDDSKPVEFVAESRWSKNDVNKDFYDTGFELVNPTNEFIDTVDALVDECLFNE